jgi:hypothetical protein
VLTIAGRTEHAGSGELHGAVTHSVNTPPSQRVGIVVHNQNSLPTRDQLASREPSVVRVGELRSSDVCVSAVHHQTFMPPSTTTSMPVMYELSSEERNRATFATSSGCPSRPKSVLSNI